MLWNEDKVDSRRGENDTGTEIFENELDEDSLGDNDNDQEQEQMTSKMAGKQSA